jgi:predicted amidohydrolase
LASDTVTSIVGFTELGTDGALYNAAAVLERGRVAGVYRKFHPAIRRSVYAAGSQTPVFRIGALTFGILICNDSNFPALAREMAARGATVLFVPTNNGLPPERASLKLNEAAREVDVSLAVENRIWIVRADVAGRNGQLTSFGSSEIVDTDGRVVQQAGYLSTELLVAEIEARKLASNARRPGPDDDLTGVCPPLVS